MKTTVVHHSADYDGIFCREIARKFLPGAELIGWDFGEAIVPFPVEGVVYILDLPPSCVSGFDAEQMPRVVWVDHHKSALENTSWKQIPGYRIDGVAACRLAWQWFQQGHDTTNQTGTCAPLPTKADFINREVHEPLAILLAGEYDVWIHRGDGDLEFQFGLDCWPEPPWNALLRTDNTQPTVNHTVQMGKVAMAFQAKRNADVMRSRSFLTEWENLRFLCLNTAWCNSNTFAALDKPETGHDALLGFFFNGRAWTVSLYHAAHRTDLDLSLIALRYNGGGHRGACGFRSATTPAFICP